MLVESLIPSVSESFLVSEQRHVGGGAPKVSVICWTYNHSEFISEAIEGILKQRVDFPVEVIIHDDASTDATRGLLNAFEEKFPSVIRLVLPTENQLQRGINFVPPLFSLARGEFLAICDGDDYWTAPDKLSRQVKCLEENPAACGCFHRADDLIENEKRIVPGFWGAPTDESYFTLGDLFRYGNVTPTASLMLRREFVLNVPGTVAETPHGDFTFLCAALRFGPLISLKESMSVYRRHGGGQHSTTYGAVANFRAMKSLVFAAHFLGIQSHPQYIEAFRWRCADLEACLTRDREQIKQLEAELATIIDRYARSRRSLFFRTGMILDRVMKSLGIR
jgi:glycosyltransferase involved in cell wall biosynthesis